MRRLASRLHIMCRQDANAALGSNSPALYWCIIPTRRGYINPLEMASGTNLATPASYLLVLYSCIMLVKLRNALKHGAALKGLKAHLERPLKWIWLDYSEQGRYYRRQLGAYIILTWSFSVKPNEV